MMKLFILLGLICTYSWSENRFQCTRDCLNNHQVYSTIKKSHMKIHVTESFIQVEEEVTLEAINTDYNNLSLGLEYRGDLSTIELIGEFELPEGSIIRSSVLFFGDDLLKANLLDAELARDLYEEVVDRNTRILVACDPSLIEKTGPDTYSYSIYPVEYGESRTIRVRYDIPWIVKDSMMHVDPRSIFNGNYTEEYLAGYLVVDSSMTIEFTSELDRPIKFKTPTKDFTVIPNFTYTIDDSWMRVENHWDLFLRSESFMLMAENRNDLVKQTHVESDSLAGYYHEIKLAVPSFFKDSINWVKRFSYTSQLRVSNADVNSIINLNNWQVRHLHNLRFFLKNDSAWTGEIEWLIFNEEGDLSYSHLVDVDPIEVEDSSLVVLWAHDEGIELGAALGYVDSRMALLALEEDTLPEPLRTQYWDEGVPLLGPDGIISEFDDLIESELSDAQITTNGNSSTNIMSPMMKKWLSWEIVDNQLLITIDGQELQGASVSAINLQGQVIQTHPLKLGLNRLDLPDLDLSQYILVLTNNQKQYRL